MSSQREYPDVLSNLVGCRNLLEFTETFVGFGPSSSFVETIKVMDVDNSVDDPPVYDSNFFP